MKVSVKITQEDFELKCRQVHKDKYDYSNDSYKSMHEFYTVTCKVHGDFRVKPVTHIHQKQGCPICAVYEKEVRLRKSRQDKVDKERKGKYTILSCKDVKSVKANCNLHCNYTTTLYSMINTFYGGCTKCKQLEEAKVFIEKANTIHTDKYIYKEEDYKCSRTLMTLYCKKHERSFNQRPSAHLQGQGCPLCGQEAANENSSKDGDLFIKQCQDVHDYEYLYNNCNYTKVAENVMVTCRKHGDFSINPSSHLKGQGCSECTSDKRKEKYSKLFQDKMSTKEIYNHLDFSKASYINNSTKVEVYCKMHNETFYTTPNKLLDANRVCGCSVCASISQNRWNIKSVRSIPNITKRKGYFYIGKIKNLKGVKVGICSSLKTRKDLYNRELKNLCSSFNYLYTLETDYLTATVIENMIKTIYKREKVKHSLDFGGKSEIFNIEDFTLIEELISGRFETEVGYLTQLCKSHKDKIFINFSEKMRSIYNIRGIHE